ncbi:hypothetical protein Scep_021458 [Stephania cephalantha]|uniref:Uncharacterized protein n=1 Tax=Stephania cephalantha TaxID=152367 RepID=A0AAP0F4D5_9MAGN
MEFKLSVSDPLLIRNGSETKFKHYVSDPLLIRNGSETDLKHSYKRFYPHTSEVRYLHSAILIFMHSNGFTHLNTCSDSPDTRIDPKSSPIRSYEIIRTKLNKDVGILNNKLREKDTLVANRQGSTCHLMYPLTKRRYCLCRSPNDVPTNGGGAPTSSISEYLIEMLPGWHVEDLLDSSTHNHGFCKPPPPRTFPLSEKLSIWSSWRWSEVEVRESQDECGGEGEVDDEKRPCGGSGLGTLTSPKPIDIETSRNNHAKNSHPVKTKYQSAVHPEVMTRYVTSPSHSFQGSPLTHLPSDNSIE